MPVVTERRNLLNAAELKALRATEPARFEFRQQTGVYLNLRGAALEPLPEIDAETILRIARVVRGFAFAAVDAGKSGHPGGSSSKTEMVLTLLFSGVLGFDAWQPKHRGRDRVVWSAGHCTPLFHAVVALIYESLRRSGAEFHGDDAEIVYPEQLARFRNLNGPSGHVESQYAFADTSTGSSGHGFSAGLGFALLHRSCGLKTRAFVIGGDAETEEGMSYEARNLASNLGVENLIVTLDYNGFGIDGPITEVLPCPYVSHWAAQGWNIIEVDGHNPLELACAYRLAASGFAPGAPTVVMCHTLKGKSYGKFEGTADSHGTPLSHAEYVEAVRKLGFDVPGIDGEQVKDLRLIAGSLTDDEIAYVVERLRAAAARIEPEEALERQMRLTLGDRPIADYTSLQRPDVLPPELVFKEGDLAPTRKATEAWFAWAMKQTGFFYIGAGDLMKSILTGKAENVYGVISRSNPLGRGIRFGIAEQNMSMLSTAIAQDTLPGGFRPMSAFATYGVFGPLMSNPVRMTLINADVNPRASAFFIMLAAHDGPETGEDGPTHHGLFWMSLFTAYPGIRVFKPLDANEAVEMLFYAAHCGQPVVFSAVRPPIPVLKRGDGVPPAIAAIHGAYVFKPFRGSGKRKVVLAISGGQVMSNVLEILPDLEERADVKLLAVTSPQRFEELRRHDPKTANSIFPDEERQYCIALHNGWRGFLYPFLLPGDYPRRVFGMDGFSRSGKPKQIYQREGFDPAGIRDKILGYLS